MVRKQKWKFDGQLFRCTFPGCGYGHNVQGAVLLHYYHNHDKQQKTGGGGSDRGGQDDNCLHKWRLLSDQVPIEKKAFDAGYIYVCIKCEELKKGD